MRRILVVAAQTAGGRHLRERVAAEVSRGPARFFVLVPAVDVGADAQTWNEHRDWARAQARLDRALASLREIGADVDGGVGSHDAFAAVRDALRAHPFDEVWVSTLPAGISRWLKLDLPSRIERVSGLPVVHLPAEVEEPA